MLLTTYVSLYAVLSKKLGCFFRSARRYGGFLRVLPPRNLEAKTCTALVESEKYRFQEIVRNRAHFKFQEGTEGVCHHFGGNDFFSFAPNWLPNFCEKRHCHPGGAQIIARIFESVYFTKIKKTRELQTPELVEIALKWRSTHYLLHFRFRSLESAVNSVWIAVMVFVGTPKSAKQTKKESKHYIIQHFKMSQAFPFKMT